MFCSPISRCLLAWAFCCAAILFAQAEDQPALPPQVAVPQPAQPIVEPAPSAEPNPVPLAPAIPEVVPPLAPPINVGSKELQPKKEGTKKVELNEGEAGSKKDEAKNDEPKKEEPKKEDPKKETKPAPAKPNNSKITYTDPSQTDADFPIQGEYVGTASWPGVGRTQVGLQVIALGDGKFSGALLRGGLPGAGWDRSERVQLDGSVTSYGVQLIGYLGSVLINQSSAQYYNAQGSSCGTLSKTERVSPTMGALPAVGATVLFSEHDKNLEQFNNAKLTKEGYLHSGTAMKMAVGDFRLHLEFRTPYMPFARGQSRGNSGVYIQQRYETQILDSFGLPGIENECGAIYRQIAPDVNMAMPPLTWQTYDMYFTAARWSADGKTKTANARLTLFHNGVAVHYQREIQTKTGAGKEEGPQEIPINIQDHGNPVALRNIWIVLGNSNLESETCPPQPPCCCRR